MASRRRGHLMTPGSESARADTVGRLWRGRSGAAPSRLGTSAFSRTRIAEDVGRPKQSCEAPPLEASDGLGEDFVAPDRLGGMPVEQSVSPAPSRSMAISL